MTRCMKAILSILLIFTVIFAYGSWFYHSPVQPTGASLEPPSAAHFLGTDNLGIDIFAQISRGYFSSMGIGLDVYKRQGKKQRLFMGICVRGWRLEFGRAKLPVKH